MGRLVILKSFALLGVKLNCYDLLVSVNALVGQHTGQPRSTG